MDDAKITTEDLYGSTASAPVPVSPIPIEETPEIPMDTSVGVPTPTASLKPEMPKQPRKQIPLPPPMPKVPSRSTMLTLFIFIILFVAGIFLSGYIRPFLAGGGSRLTTVPTPTAELPTPAPVAVDPFDGWREATIAGLSYKLPPDVVAPTCDGAACVSEGTYLPGGTRFTIALKTVTQSLSSLRGAAITDAAGTAFTSNDATVSGHTAIEFTGAFTGRTSGGYGFSQMHGFMIEVTPTTTLEINHFTPAGITADFASEDVLFTKIISTMTFASEPPMTTATPVSATTSGD